MYQLIYMSVHSANCVRIGKMLDSAPIGFEVERDGADGEKYRVLYSRPNDKFYQLQESLSECSTFIDDQIMKGKQVVMIKNFAI